MTTPEFYIRTTGAGDVPGNALTIGGHVFLSGCGFPAQELATYAFFLPDGRVVTGETLVDEIGSWEVRWWSVPGEPLGEYRFEFYSSAGVYSAPFVVYDAAGPLVSHDCGSDAVTVALIGFQPGEEALLARYADAPANNLLDYGYVTIGPDGSAMVTLPREDVVLIVIGQNAQPMDWYDTNGNDLTVLASEMEYLICSFSE
jgi:hypothetical protein